MRLAAIYIPSSSLEHVFGKGHNEFTVNFGGNSNYHINLKEKCLSVERVTINDNFIKDFFGKKISSISAIVGRNGVGKTSILRAIHMAGDKAKKNVFYLFESIGAEHYYYNELLEVNVESELKLIELDKGALNHVKQYYTPIVDIEQIKSYSQLNIVSTGEENLIQLYNKQLLQDVILLNDPVVKKLKEVYKDFPEYNQLEISIPKLKRFDFKNVYASANLGNENRTSVLKIYIEDDIRKLEESGILKPIEVPTVIDKYLKRYIGIINSSGLNSLFERLWDLDDYQIQDQELIHNGNDFIKNLEITIFSYFILDATFPQTPFQGVFDIEQLFQTSSFQGRFDTYLDLYLTSIYGIVRDGIESKLNRISIQDYDDIKLILEQRHDKISTRGFKTSDAIKLMLGYLDRFKSFYDLYNYILKAKDENLFQFSNGKILYNFEEHSQSDFQVLIEKYNKVLTTTSGYVMRLNLLSISSSHPLSSGEKALLSFFSRLNDRVNRLKSSTHTRYDYYLLLLDEPELGYHPIWKRKFVDALTKIVPIIYSKLDNLKSLIDDSKSELVSPCVQIVFTTHDPLTLSDIPQGNVVYLDKNDENLTFINQEKVETFGANIHDILAHSFFLENGFMGEFAEGMIKSLINYLTKEEYYCENPQSHLQWNRGSARQFINTVDEPFIKERLDNLFDEEYLLNDRQELLNKRDEIDARLREMENEED